MVSGPDYVLEHSTFQIANAGDTLETTREELYLQGPPTYYDVSALIFQSHALRYKYTYSNYNLMNFLAMRTNRLTALELRKLKPSERSAEYEDLIDSLEREVAVYHREIDKPASWTFWDSDIPKWYEAWKKLEA